MDVCANESELDNGFRVKLMSVCLIHRRASVEDILERNKVALSKIHNTRILLEKYQENITRKAFLKGTRQELIAKTIRN